MSEQNYALARVPGEEELGRLMRLADALGKSGYYGVSSPEQALAKIMTGADLGMSPVQALMGIHVIEGRPSLGANAYAAKVRQHPDYDYRVIAQNDTVCEIEFFATFGSKKRAEWESLGTYRVDIGDMDKRGISAAGSGKRKNNWARHPDAMLFARAISQGARIYCPDVFSGGTYYTHGEIEDSREPITVTAEVVEPSRDEQWADLQKQFAQAAEKAHSEAVQEAVEARPEPERPAPDSEDLKALKAKVVEAAKRLPDGPAKDQARSDYQNASAAGDLENLGLLLERIERELLVASSRKPAPGPLADAVAEVEEGYAEKPESMRRSGFRPPRR